MENFTYQNKTKIIFGKNSENLLGKELISLGIKKVLLHYGSGSIKKIKLYEKIVNQLNEAKIEFIELPGVIPNPRLSLVQKGINICKKENVDLILAVGGGSVIDSAKGIAFGTKLTTDIWEYYVSRNPISNALPVACILTIPAAGSESSPNSVITDEKTKRKLGYGHELLRPIFSILNPELFYNIPKNHRINGICDMICHIFERYFSNTPNVDITDGLCESVLKTIIKNAPILNKNEKNYNAWAEIAFAGNLAHNNLLGLGREQDWGCHGIEHELSAIYDVSHGAGLAVIFPAWMEYLASKKTEKFAQFSHNVFDIPKSDNDEADARKGIQKLKTFFKSLGLPNTLRELGITDKTQFENMAKKAVYRDFSISKEIPQGHFFPLYKNDILKILEIAF